MHLKLVLALALVSVCAARSILDYDKFFVKVDYDTIYIKNIKDHEVRICINKLMTPYIKVFFTMPTGYMKTFDIDDIQVGYGEEYLSGILYQIFKRYEGELDKVTYMELLSTLEKYVELQKVSPVVLLVLRALCCEEREIYGLLDMGIMGYKYSDLYKPYSRVSDMYRGFGKYDDIYSRMYGDYYRPYSYSSRDIYRPYDRECTGYECLLRGYTGYDNMMYKKSYPYYSDKTMLGKRYTNLLGYEMY